MTEFWRYGPTPLPFSEVGRFARDMESMGWDGLAVGENARQPDPYATLTLAAVATTKLRLGTATVVPTRPPLLHAISMTTTQAVSGGRTRFSIGRGDSAVRSLNQAPMSVARFEAYLRQLQGYLRREDVDIDGAVTTMKGLSAIDPSLAITKPPVDVAASGPKLIDVAIRTADSVTFAVGADPERLQACIEHARQVSSSIGRDFSSINLGCYVQVAVSDDGDRDRARDMIRPLVMTFVRFSGYEGKVEGADAATAKAHYFKDRDVDDEFIDRFAVIGPADHCAERLQRIIDLGVDRIYIGTRYMGIDPTETNTTRIGSEVLPRLRRRMSHADPGGSERG